MFLILGCLETFLDKVWPVTIKVDSFSVSGCVFCFVLRLPALNLQPTGWASLLQFDLANLNSSSWFMSPDILYKTFIFFFFFSPVTSSIPAIVHPKG